MDNSAVSTLGNNNVVSTLGNTNPSADNNAASTLGTEDSLIAITNKATFDSLDAIDIAAHQDNPRKRKLTSDATENESTSVKRKRPSTAAPGKGISVVGKGKRIVTQMKLMMTSPRKKREPKRNVNQVELEEHTAKVSEELNRRYERNELSHKVFARMFYDSYGDFFLVKIFDFDKGKFMKPFKEDNVVEKYDDYLITSARKYANVWVGNTPGAPGDGNSAPAYLSTKIATIYQQHSNRFCLTYSLASALFYCGFKDESSVLSSLANTFSMFHFEQAIETLVDFMPSLVPQLGRPTIYQRRTKSRILRRLTIDDVINDLSPYPTLIIPFVADGNVSHALCVVDDLIFDSITPFALKLQRESFDWIFNNCELKIYLALRFMTKVSPIGSKIETTYQRRLILHQDSSSDNITQCFEERVFAIAPEDISTKIPAMHQQHDARFALTYSLASALRYHGLEQEAFKLVSKAVSFSCLRPYEMLAKIKEHMQSISIVTEYPKDHERKKARRRGPLSWEDVLSSNLPYPTAIIPVLPNEKVLLPFCVIGNLIFHSITPFALKLHKDTLNWLFDKRETKIHKALRFTFFIKVSQPEKKSITMTARYILIEIFNQSLTLPIFFL